MKEENVLDVTTYGPIRDIDGYLDCTDNFNKVLSHLFTVNEVLKNRQKVRILNSIVVYLKNDPRRSVLPQVLTFGFLCKLYKNFYNKDFNAETCKEDCYWNLLVKEKHSEGRAAWGLYSNDIHQQKIKTDLVNFEKSIQQLPEKTKKIKRDEYVSFGQGRIFIG